MTSEERIGYLEQLSERLMLAANRLLPDTPDDVAETSDGDVEDFIGFQGPPQLGEPLPPRPAHEALRSVGITLDAVARALDGERRWQPPKMMMQPGHPGEMHVQTPLDSHGNEATR